MNDLLRIKRKEKSIVFFFCFLLIFLSGGCEILSGPGLSGAAGLEATLTAFPLGKATNAELYHEGVYTIPTILVTDKGVDLTVFPIANGTYTIKSPTQMELGDTELVELIIIPDSVQQPTPKTSLEANGGTDLLDPQQLYKGIVEIYSDMQAELNGEGFEIKSAGRSRQYIEASRVSKWTWYVKASESGPHYLSVIVNVPIQVQGSPSEKNLIFETMEVLVITNTPTAEITKTPRPSLSEVVDKLLPVLQGSSSQIPGGQTPGGDIDGGQVAATAIKFDTVSFLRFLSIIAAIVFVAYISIVSTPKIRERIYRTVEKRPRLASALIRLKLISEADAKGSKLKKGNIQNFRSQLNTSSTILNPRDSIVGILSVNGKIVGTGVYVKDKEHNFIITAAHVLTTHYGKIEIGDTVTLMAISGKSTPIQAEIAWIDVEDLMTANASEWPAEKDIAVLRLLESSPHSLLPSRIITENAEIAKLTQCWCFGFGKQSGNKGRNIENMTIGREVAQGYYQARSGDDNDCLLEPGFSGAPVWNEEGMVVGLVQSVTGTPTAYIIPAKILREILNSL